jgi:heme/copper-type cytochrome/quinol oxidase subunit 2
LTFVSAFSGLLQHSQTSKPTKGSPMKLLTDLFSTDYGLMSLAVILFVLLMAAFFVRMFVRKMNNKE